MNHRDTEDTENGKKERKRIASTRTSLFFLPLPTVLRVAVVREMPLDAAAQISDNSLSRRAALAQLVEHRIRNARVAGSSPAGG